MADKGVEKVYSYQEQTSHYNKQMAVSVRTYSDLIDELAELEEMFAILQCTQYRIEHDKMGMEKIEKDVARLGEKVTEYGRLIYLRKNEHGLRRIINGADRGLSSIQSLMKYDRPVHQEFGG